MTVCLSHSNSPDEIYSGHQWVMGLITTKRLLKLHVYLSAMICVDKIDGLGVYEVSQL